MIPRSFIEDLIVKCDLVKIIGSRVKLKAKGGKYFGACPFHKEKTPSFVVNTKEQFYYCFGCHAHGNVLDFIMHFEHLDFKNAVVYLANYLNLPLPLHDAYRLKQEQQRKGWLKICQELAHYYYRQVEGNLVAQRYLVQRGINQQSRQNFLIGYAPNNFYLKKWSLQHQQALETLGLLNLKGNYPRFRGRLMFPIRNELGQVIGFGGRIFQGKEVKYLNSPETPLFHKRDEVYGLYEAKKNSVLDELIVVEGYLDVVSLFQFQIPNVVATLGTAVTQSQLRKILRYTKKIVFCFDGDLAGNEAAKRAMQLLLPLMQEEIEGSFVFLPVHEDPDSWVRKLGTERFKDYLNKHKKSLIEFLITTLKENANIASLEGKIKYVNKAQSLLKELPNGWFKNLLLEQIAAEINVSPDQIADVAAFQQKQELLDERKPLPITEVQKKILQLLVYYPQILLKLTSTQQNYLDQLENEVFKRSLRILRQNVSLTVGEFLEYWRKYNFDLKEVITKPLLNEEQALAEVETLIEWLMKTQKTETIDNLIQQLSHSTDRSERLMLQQMIYELKIKGSRENGREN